MRYGYEVLIIPLAEIYSLFPVIVFTNHQCTNAILYQPFDTAYSKFMRYSSSN